MAIDNLAAIFAQKTLRNNMAKIRRNSRKITTQDELFEFDFWTIQMECGHLDIYQMMSYLSSNHTIDNEQIPRTQKN